MAFLAGLVNSASWAEPKQQASARSLHRSRPVSMGDIRPRLVKSVPSRALGGGRSFTTSFTTSGHD